MMELFKKIPNKKNLCVGVDPAKNITKKANKEGVKTYPNFLIIILENI